MSISVGNPDTKTRNIDILCVETPLEPELAWEVEVLLLQVFEYGDYSFRAALRGDYAETLDCTFALARQGGCLVGAAGCLCARRRPTAAIIGPVGVHAPCRRQGIGARLLDSLVAHLKRRSCTTAYLGVSPANPAVDLYRKIGFENHRGIVMRLVLDPKRDIEEPAIQENGRVSIRRVCWGDFPSAGALLSYPGSMYTYDLRRGLFSSRYVRPQRFLSVFPEMMKTFTRHGGFANVLVAGDEQQVMGIAQVNMLPSAAQRHMAELGFYVHDTAIRHAHSLVKRTLRECSTLSVRRITGSCLSCDYIKRGILDKIGGRQVAVLPSHVWLERSEVDALIYELDPRL